VAAAYAALREVVPPLERDRFLAPDIAAAEKLLSSGRLLAAVSAVRGVGRLEA
jgi:histidine ammonia-lyase